MCVFLIIQRRYIDWNTVFCLSKVSFYKIINFLKIKKKSFLLKKVVLNKIQSSKYSINMIFIKVIP